MPSFTDTYHTSPNQYKLTLNITQGAGNVNTNSTPVSWSLQLTTPSNNYFQAIATYSAVINGVTVLSRNQQVDTYAVSTTYTLASGATTVAHNADGTKTIAVSASFKTNDQSSYWRVPPLSVSGNVTLTTIPRYASITSFSASINDLSATISWTADRTISQWRYSTNSGSSYSSWIAVNSTSGSRSISVSPGSTYGFRIQVRNAASGLDTTSSTLSRTAAKTPSTLSFNTTSQNVGSGITWTINESYDYTYKITYAFGNTSGYILGSNSAASNTTTGTWTVPISLANQIPNASSGVGTIYIYTYYGSTHIGTKSYAFTATVPDNSTFRPTATISSIVQGTTMPAGIAVFVQNQSKAKVTSSGTGKYSATIQTYSVSVANIGTYTGSVITSAFLRNSGSVRVTLTVTDSRGLQGSTYQDISVVPYSPPQITFSAVRNAVNPANIEATFDGYIAPINNKNYRYFRIRSKASDGSWNPETDSTQDYTFSGTQIIPSSPDKSYTIEIFVQDSFTSITRTVQVGTGFTLMDFHENGRAMAIGKVSEDNYFEVGMPTTIFTDEPNLLTLKRSHPFESNVNVNLVFENDFQTRYLTFKETGRPAWADVANVNQHGYDFWTTENLSSSSREIKKDIENTNHQENFDVFKGLKVYDYNLKDEFDEKKTREKDHIGLITDEVPDFLTDKDQSYIKIYDLLSLTVSTLQTTIKKVETLELKVKDLENENEKLKGGNQID